MDHAADAMRTDLMTITRHVLNEQSKFPEARGDLTILLNNIVLGCKFVCSSVSKVWSLSPVLVNSTGDVYHIVALLELVCVIASSKIYCLSYMPLHLSVDSLSTWTLSSLSHWFCWVNISGALLFQRLRFLSMACALTQLLEVYFLSPYVQFLMRRYMISSWPYFYGFKYKFGFQHAFFHKLSFTMLHLMYFPGVLSLYKAWTYTLML